MATVYFDLPNVTNGTGTSASPKNATGWAATTPAAGDVFLFKRGTSSASTAFTLTAGTAGNVIKWGAWYNADGTDDSTKAKPILNTSTVLSTYVSANKDYIWLDNLDIRSPAIAVADDKSLIFLGTGSTISSCNVDTNISAVGAWGKSNVTITNNTLFGVSHSSANNNCVLIVSDTPAMDNIKVTYNTIKHYGGGTISSHAVRLACSDAVNTLTNLVCQYNTVTTSTGTYCANTSAIGMRISNTPNALIDNNTITYFLEGIFFFGGSANMMCYLRNNTCNNNSHFGIHLTSKTVGCIIDGNTCSYNGSSAYDGITIFSYGRGIELSSSGGQGTCSNHTVRFNTCNNNYNYGGSLDNGSEGVGIGLDDGTSGCTVYGNSCSNNEGNGIQLYGGTLGSGTPPITDTGGNNIIANFLNNNCTAAIKNRRTGGDNTTLFNSHISISVTIGTTSYIAHNVCLGTTPCAMSINPACDDLIIANNIITSPHGIAMDVAYSASTGVCNSNDFFGVGQNYCLRSTDVSGSATFAANAYVAVNDLTIDPKFTTTYRLSAGSTAISAGFAIGARLDFVGRSYNPNPSLGMYEWFAITSVSVFGGSGRKRISRGH